MSLQASNRPTESEAQVDLLESFRALYRIRHFERLVKREFEQGNIPGFTHLYLGQEAVAVAACAHLDERDYLVSNHRGHGHALARGCDLVAIFAEILGRAGGLCKGKGGSMHLADAVRGFLGCNGIVGAGAPLAVGAALTAKRRGEGGVSVAFLGDGASNEGVVFESLNLAVVLRLPVVFLFENNQYGEATPARYAVGAESIAERAAGFGLKATRFDGTDYLTAHATLGEIIHYVRESGAPACVEADVVRFEGHYVGDSQRYRSKRDVAAAQAERDPVARLEQLILERGVGEADALAAVRAAVEKEVEGAYLTARRQPFPEPAELFRDIYATDVGGPILPRGRSLGQGEVVP
ncbi:MAG: ABC transporter substrate-binding protein [Porticoccaceae bacterium]|nr:MAG: ABC transporter substrate-binding protein [Porticoccaceae bacterium]